jgi:hypothetical protein
MAQYDLTPTLGGYLDRHMMIPLLEFLLKTDVRSLLINLTFLSLSSLRNIRSSTMKSRFCKRS